MKVIGVKKKKKKIFAFLWKLLFFIYSNTWKRKTWKTGAMGRCSVWCM